MKTYHYGGCSIPIQMKIYLSIYLSIITSFRILAKKESKIMNGLRINKTRNLKQAESQPYCSELQPQDQGREAINDEAHSEFKFRQHTEEAEFECYQRN